jgi:hypothetical protein
MGSGLKINKKPNMFITVYFYCQAVQAFPATSMQISAQYIEDNLRRNFFCQLPVFFLGNPAFAALLSRNVFNGLSRILN